jgi:hypothetical protein
MEKQKNLNNPSASQLTKTAIQKNIPTVAGAMIILIAAVFVGAGMFYFLQTSFFEGSYVNPISLKASVSKGEGKKITEKVVEGAFDFDSELKKLDEQNNTIISDDFNENEMSDANMGL